MISIATTTFADLGDHFKQCGNISNVDGFIEQHEDDVGGIVNAAVEDPTTENIRNAFRTRLGCDLPTRLCAKIATSIERLNRATARRSAKSPGGIAYHG